MDITKEMEGQTIYGVFVKHHRSVHRKNRKPLLPEAFTVVKVKRKYVDLQERGRSAPTSYCPEAGITESMVRSGDSGEGAYKFFDSEEAATAYIAKEDQLEEITIFFRDYDWRKNLSNNQVDGIYKIITT